MDPHITVQLDVEILKIDSYHGDQKKPKQLMFGTLQNGCNGKIKLILKLKVKRMRLLS